MTKITLRLKGEILSNTEKILIVDDDPLVLDTLKEIVSYQTDYNVITAADGLIALEILQKEKIPVVISDFRMPNMDGIELLVKIKNMDSDMKVILMTGFYEPLLEEIAKKNGAIAIHQKPINFQKLVEDINSFTTKSERGFKGSINGIDLPVIIQMLCLTHSTKTIHITYDNQAFMSSICIKEGNIIHAEFDDLIGSEAFKAIIKLNEGNFKVGMTSSSTPQTIKESWNKLLLDCMN